MVSVGSDPWLEAFAAAVAGIDAGDLRITVRHRIVDGPAWVVRAADGGVSVGRGDDDGDADVTFTWSADDAEAVARGELGALVPFQAGRLRIGGDLDRLREAAALFERFPSVA
jgi:alkyl sulfatase BDS1-like metallo-beta-lactamase superfamily hydrolase